MKTTKVPYELLIRFGGKAEPGDKAGSYGYRGAHVIDLVRTTENGEVIAETPQPARPVTLDEMGEILGERNAELIEAADAAIAARAAAEERQREAEGQQRTAQEARIAAEEALLSERDRANKAEESAAELKESLGKVHSALETSEATNNGLIDRAVLAEKRAAEAERQVEELQRRTDAKELDAVDPDSA